MTDRSEGAKALTRVEREQRLTRVREVLRQRPRRESNPHLRLDRAASSPLNDRGKGSGG